MSDYVGRLAPSPTGSLHLGNARSFLITWLHCRAHGGKLVMRMEDLNIDRLKPGAVEQAYEDLRWMGLDWDAGAGMEHLGRSKDPDEQDYIQTNALEHYESAFLKIESLGRVYPCSCTRKDIIAAQSAPHAEDELRYPGTCRDRWPSEAEASEAKGQPAAWRFRCSEEEIQFEDGFYGTQKGRVATWSGDFVIAPQRSKVAYQLAVVVDDARHGITRVIRADDLLLSTQRQLELYHALELPAPEFIHLPLVVGPDGRRLAKRHGDWKISRLREQNIPVEKLLGYLAHTCGMAEFGEACTLAQLQERFDLKRIPTNQVEVEPELEDYFFNR